MSTGPGFFGVSGWLEGLACSADPGAKDEPGCEDDSDPEPDGPVWARVPQPAAQALRRIPELRSKKSRRVRGFFGCFDMAALHLEPSMPGA